MSAFPSDIGKLKNTRQLIDDEVALVRAKGPPPGSELRQQTRLSVAELNDADWESVRERLSKIRKYDNRPPVVKFLDVIDLPRNTLLATLAPGLAKRARESGNTGTFGRGKVMFSDVLGEMGMRPGIVRGALGFVGDVAMDPLTYAGPPGWGVKAATTAGKTLRVGAAGTRAFKSGTKAAVKGGIGSVRAKEVADVLRAAGHTDESIAALRTAKGNKNAAHELYNDVFGAPVGPQGKFGRVLRPTADFVGLTEKSTTPGKLARGFDDLTDNELSRTAKAFVARYGDGGGLDKVVSPARKVGRLKVPQVRTGRAGIGIGDATSAVAHIPGTDIALRVPGFTDASKVALVNQAQANIRMDAKNPSIKVAEDIKRQADDLSEAQRVYETAYTNPEAIMYPTGGAPLRQEDFMAAQREKILAASKNIDLLSRNFDQADDIADPTDAFRAGSMLNEALLRTEQSLARHDEAKSARETLSNVRKIASGEKLDTLGDTMRFASVTGEDIAGQARSLGLTLDPVKVRDEIASMSPEEMTMLSGYVDTLHRRWRADSAYANAVGGSLMQATRHKDRAVANSALRMMNLDPDEVGYSVFAPFSAAARSVYDPEKARTDAMLRSGAWGRTRFAQRTGTINAARRQIRMHATGNARRDAETLAQSGANELAAIGAEHLSDPMQMDRLAESALAMVYMVRDPGAELYRSSDAVWDVLSRIQTSGILRNEVVRGKVRAWATKYAKMLDDFEATERAEGLLGAGIKGYVPGTLGPDSQKLVASRLAFEGGAQSGGAARGQEAFQKPRSTYVYEWEGPNGTRELFQWELDAYGDIPDSAIARMPEAIERSEAVRIKELADELKAMEPSQLPQARPTSIFEINERVRSGAFKTLVGNGFNGNFFETNPAIIMASRLGQRQAAAARQTLNEIGRRLAIPVHKLSLTDAPQRTNGITTVHLANGVTAKIVGKDDGLRLVVGDQSYRKLKSSVAEPGSIISAWLEDDAHHLFYPEKYAEALESAHETLKDAKGLLKATETMTNAWKTVTLMHPSWTMFNTVGNLILAGQLGIDPVSLAREFPAAVRMILHKSDPGKLAGKTVDLRGEQSASDLLSQAVNSGVANSAFFDNDALRLVTNGHVATPSIIAAAARGGGTIGQRAGRAAGAVREASAHAKRGIASLESGGRLRDAKPLDKLKYVKQAAWDDGVMRRIVTPWYKANALAEEATRMAAYMALIRRGDDPAHAANAIREGMYDYSDFSNFERGYLKRLLPFYSWLRNSAVHQVRMLLQDPKWMAVYPKLKEAIEEATAGEDQLPDHLRPSWMREQLAIQIGGDPEKRWAVTLGTAVPAEAAMRIGGAAVGGLKGIQDLLEYGMSSFGPAVRVPSEIGVGREFFSKRQIGASVEEGDLTIGEYLAGQVRPLRELGLVGVRQAPVAKAYREGGLPVAAGRVAIGGRLQPFTQERTEQYRQREYDEKARSVRKAITIAEREGDKNASLRARVRLMSVYRQMESENLKIPRWASQQLAR